VLQPLVYADVELVVVAFLRSRLTGLAPVHVRTPSPRTTPFVTVRRSGGTADGLFDRALLDIFVWGSTDEEAKDLAQRCLTEFGSMRGVQGGARVMWVSQFAGLAPAPDASTDHRWTFSVEVAIRGVQQ